MVFDTAISAVGCFCLGSYTGTLSTRVKALLTMEHYGRLPIDVHGLGPRGRHTQVVTDPVRLITRIQAGAVTALGRRKLPYLRPDSDVHPSRNTRGGMHDVESLSLSTACMT